ncbi:C2H2-like zinc finger protein [Raphanus sativus]|nr:C2H2-like zinc finger protein [Raphanus sativus]
MAGLCVFFKNVLNQSNSESFSSSYASEIDQEHKNTALSLMMMSIDSKGHNLVVNSLAESSENNYEILEIKASSGEQLKMIFTVKDQDLKTDKVAVDDQLRSTNDVDSYSSDSDYFMNCPKKSDSDVSVDMSQTLDSTDADSKSHRSGDSKSLMVKKPNGANKNSKGHESPICFKVFKSGQTFGGHKRSHCFESQEHMIKHKAAAGMAIDLNLPAQDDI